ncbi:MAG: glycosyl transferase [Cyanobacteria bacterium P01_B01_bin.77]
MTQPVQSVQWSSSARWLTPLTPRHRFYLRRTLTLPSYAQAAWLRLSADNDFVLYVNGQSVAVEYSYFGRIPRNSLGLSKYSSLVTQTINESTPYDLKTGDIIQTSYTRDWKLTKYIDLSNYLIPGKNVIAVEIQASHLHPRLLVEGKIYPTSDRTAAIQLATNNKDWVFSPLPVNRQKLKWSDVEFPDQDWQIPKQQRVTERTYSRVSVALWDQMLLGQWITGRQKDTGEIRLQKQWVIPNPPNRAVIRLAGDGYYSILINNQLVHQNSVIEGDQLNLYEVTKLLHPGINTVSASLLGPLVTDGVSTNVPLAMYLDGWTESNNGEVRNAIATNTTWQSSTWANDTDTLKSASLVKRPIPHRLERAYWGDASRLQTGRYLQQQARWMGGGILMALSTAWGIGLGLQQSRDSDCKDFESEPSTFTNALLLGTTGLVPGLFFLIIVGLLKHRYAEAERGIFFAQADVDWLILMVFLCITVVTCLWICCPQRPHHWQRWGLTFLTGWLICTGLGIVLNSYLPALLIMGGGVVFGLRHTGRISSWSLGMAGQIQGTTSMLGWLQGIWPDWLIKRYRHYHWLLGLILLVGFCLRAYHIGFNDLEPDENVSYDAVRGILRTGAPISTSQIWYTRGPFFHYPLAIWLKIVGLSPENARMWSVLWGMATLVMVFVFTRLITGKVWIALVATAVLAIDPWELWYSRNVRFYQQTQFLYLFSYWSFYRGFIEASVLTQPPKRWYQYFCCISLASILLTQEVTVTLMPVFILGALYFYRPYHWKSDWRVLMSSFVAGSLFVFNALVFSIKCLTPLVGLSSMTTGHLKFQVSNITFFGTDFFVGFNRMHTVYSLLFFCGWLYFCWQKDGRRLFLFNTVLINVIFITVLVSLKASRYTYPFYPLFSLLAVYSAFTLAEWLGKHLQSWLGERLLMKGVAIASASLLLLGNIEPDRILTSYSESLTPRHLEVSQYIVDHQRPEDVVISNTPSVHANVLKGADYYVPHRMSFFDAVYMNNGRLIDRWEGRQVLTNADQLQRVLTSTDRVWIHVFHQPQLPLDAELAKFYDILQTTGEPILDTFSTSLRLWERDKGILNTTPNRGRDLGAY